MPSALNPNDLPGVFAFSTSLELPNERIAWSLIACVLLPIAAGCATYSPEPLDTHDLHAEWNFVEGAAMLSQERGYLA